jgi:hypothetical protein
MTQVQPTQPQQQLRGQSSPQAQGAQPSRALSPASVTAIVVGAFVGTLTVAGLCAGVVSLGYPWARDAAEEAESIVTKSPPMTQQSVVDWKTQRVLAEVYTAAVDHVVKNEAVIEQLGKPVETDIEAAELYRRVTGELDAASETMEFDIVGPKGRGAVRVVADGVDAARTGTGKVKVLKITVTLEDGSVIDVEPPPEWNLQVR